MIQLETFLYNSLTAAFPGKNINTGVGSGGYPVIMIEEYTPRKMRDKTFGRDSNTMECHYQIRVVAKGRAESLTLSAQVEAHLWNVWNTNTLILGGGWTCIDMSIDSYIPSITRADAAGVTYTQSGPEVSFKLQK